jgi:hypothetical protein
MRILDHNDGCGVVLRRDDFRTCRKLFGERQVVAYSARSEELNASRDRHPRSCSAATMRQAQVARSDPDGHYWEVCWMDPNAING